MTFNDWLHKVPVQNPEMAWRIVDEECIIVDPQGSQATVLNPVAARIWELADGKSTLSAILDLITQEYDVDRAQAEADALEFVEELRKRSLISFEGETENGQA